MDPLYSENTFLSSFCQQNGSNGHYFQTEIQSSGIICSLQQWFGTKCITDLWQAWWLAKVSYQELTKMNEYDGLQIYENIVVHLLCFLSMSLSFNFDCLFWCLNEGNSTYRMLTDHTYKASGCLCMCRCSLCLLILTETCLGNKNWCKLNSV